MKKVVEEAKIKFGREMVNGVIALCVYCTPKQAYNHYKERGMKRYLACLTFIYKII